MGRGRKIAEKEQISVLAFGRLRHYRFFAVKARVCECCATCKDVFFVLTLKRCVKIWFSYESICLYVFVHPTSEMEEFYFQHLKMTSIYFVTVTCGYFLLICSQNGTLFMQIIFLEFEKLFISVNYDKRLNKKYANNYVVLRKNWLSQTYPAVVVLYHFWVSYWNVSLLG